MRMFLMVFLLFALHCGVLYLIWYKFKQPSYVAMLDRLYKEFPNCEFVILYGAKSKKPYGFTFEPKLSMLLIVDMESLNRFHRPPEPMIASPLGTDEIHEFELIDYIKEKLNVPQSRHPNSG